MDELNRNDNNESLENEFLVDEETKKTTDNEVNETIQVVAKEEKPPINYKKEILDWVFTLGLAVIIALLVRNFVFTLVLVDGDSMQNTLQDKERLVVSRLPYTPKYGDIIIFKPKSDPSKVFVKRVIATEGQTVSINYDEGKVYVDGKALDEPYIKEQMVRKFYYQDFGPEVVPEDCVFVLGDNRNSSHDSRSPDVGMVHKKTILGKAVLRFWPINKFEVLKHAN